MFRHKTPFTGLIDASREILSENPSSMDLRQGKRINSKRGTKDHRKENKKKKEKESFQRRLMKYEALPEYLKDNEFILDYYRSEWPLKDAIFSVFSWHNETLNVWTHLGGFIIFVVLTVMSLMDRPTIETVFATFFRVPISSSVVENLNVSDNRPTSFLDSQSLLVRAHKEQHVDIIPTWPWFVFLTGAMACLICSSLSHLLACHSECFNLFFWRLDYAGISLMIICSFFTPVYYAFFCNPFSQLIYLTSICLLGIFTIITLLAPALSTPKFRSFRAFLFLTMGFSAVVPAAHALILYWGDLQVFVSVGYYLVQGILYAVGVGFYVSRVPERWKPGAFDIAGHSHQIFHVFVVAAALVHSAATLNLMDWRQGLKACNV